MRKWLRRILLCVILVFVIWAGCLYNCAVGNRKYNVLIETKQQGIFSPRYYVGSGVMISKDGLILTAKHVVENADSLRVTLPDGRVFDVNDYYMDVENDVGVVKLPVDFNDYMTLGDSNDVASYDIIYNIGNAKGIWENSISFGIIHSIKFKRLGFQRYGFENCEFILARMKIHGGCSGGGVYHYNKLIGIAVMGGPGAAIIVPSNVCAQVIEDYRNASKK